MIDSIEIDAHVEFLHFAWKNHGLAEACKTVRRMVDNDSESLREINHRLNQLLPDNVKAPTGNARNQLIDF